MTLRFHSIVAALLASLFALAGHAQTFPSAPVKLIVPLTAGSGADTAARLLASSLGKVWKQPVVVDNRPGAGGLIGTAAVVSAEPNGYTLLVQSAGYAANPAVFKKLPYDAANTLIDVSLIGSTQYVLVTAPGGSYKSLKDLIAAAKAKPGEVTFGSVGLGSSTHFAAEYFSQAAGIRTLHVPYKGGPEVIQDVMAGRIGFAMASLSTALGQIRGGKLLALGVAGASRAESAPEIPTIAEQGFANFDMRLWMGLWAPAGTPAAVVQQINADTRRAMQDPEFLAAFAKAGFSSQAMGTAEFARFVADEMQKFQKTAKEARIEPQ
jgi:tripartite-type tricarboxylate transporter receptor subunit TctC